jgi:hypothetical protein
MSADGEKEKEILFRLGAHLVSMPQDAPNTFGRFGYEKRFIERILNHENLSFEHKKEIIEKLALLAMFVNSGLIHVGSNVAEFDMIGDALLVFKVKDDTDFQEKIGHLDKVLQIFEDSAMHPFATMEKTVQYEEQLGGAYV